MKKFKKLKNIRYPLTLLFALFLVWTGALTAANPTPPVPAKGNPFEGYLLVRYLLYQEEYKQAESVMDRFLKQFPDDPFILTEKALMLQNGQVDVEKSLALIKKAKDIYPGYYYSNYVEAVILFSRFRDDQTKVDRALKSLEIAMKDNPDFFETYFLMGAILSDRKQYSQSNIYLEKANRLMQTVKSYLYIAANYHQLNESAQEIATYKKLLEFSPNNYTALLALSHYYLEKKEYKTAIRYLEILFSRDPDNPQVSVEYLYTLFVAGEIEKFKEISNQVDIASSPLILYVKALVLSREGKFAEAEQLLKTSKNIDKDSYLLLSEIYLHQQDYFQAYEILDKISPKEYNIYYYLARLQTLSLLNLNQRTVELFDQIKTESGSLSELTDNVFYTVLFAYSDLNRLDKIKEVVDFAVAHLQKDTPSKETTAQVQPLKDLQTLLRDFSPGQLIEPERLGVKLKYDRNLLLLLGIYKKNKQFNHIESLIKMLLPGKDDLSLPATPTGPTETAKEETSSNIYLELCDNYQEQKRYSETETLLKHLLKRFPGSNRVKNFYAYFLAQQGHNLEYALELSDQAMTKDKNNPAYVDTYGYILFRLGRVDEAEKYLEEAQRKLPFESEIMEHLAECYRTKKKYQRIIDMYQKAIDFGADNKDQLIKEIEALKLEVKPKETTINKQD